MRNNSLRLACLFIFAIALLLAAGCTSNGIGTNTLTGDIDEVDSVMPQAPKIDATKVHTYRYFFNRNAIVVGDTGAAEPWASLAVLTSPGGSLYTYANANRDGSFRINNWTGGFLQDNENFVIQQESDLESWSDPVSITFIPTVSFIP